jgi:5-(carboxyamino)imidazole ribonucleotide synthase
MLARSASAFGVSVKLHPPTVSSVIEIGGNKKKGIITFEWENLDQGVFTSLKGLNNPLISISPNISFVECFSNRQSEKTFLTSLGIAVAPYIVTPSLEDVHNFVTTRPNRSFILKSIFSGYDGRGQFKFSGSHFFVDQKVRDEVTSLIKTPSVLEECLSFEDEVSLVVARSVNGEICNLPLIDTFHRNGILLTARAPSRFLHLSEEANNLAKKIMEFSNYVGVLCIEFFVVDGALVVNEIAPRVHNSGHFSIEGAITSQFEQHIRAIIGLPLGSMAMKGVAWMHNILGGEELILPKLERFFTVPEAKVHWYSKEERPLRKLGHVTVVAEEEVSLAKAIAKIQQLLE